MNEVLILIASLILVKLLKYTLNSENHKSAFALSSDTTFSVVFCTVSGINTSCTGCTLVRPKYAPVRKNAKAIRSA